MSTTHATFAEAENDCILRSGHLLYVNDQEEYDLVVNELERIYLNTETEWWFIGEWLQIKKR